MGTRLTQDQIEELDNLIFDNQKLDYFQRVRELTDCDLKDAMEALATRYKQLRIKHPEKFRLSDKEYWGHFYS